MKPKFILLIITLVFAAIVNAGSSDFNPRVDDWDAVQDWEIEVCSKWGGTDEAQQGATTTNKIALSQLTLSLQAKKVKYPDNTILYTVSYYIEPVSGEKTFAVRLFNTKNNSNYSITTPTKATPSSPGVYYGSVQLTGDFDIVQMAYGSATSIENTVAVPIINKTGYYHIKDESNTGAGSSSGSSSNPWAGWK